jgi:hypothetical protein
MTRGQKASKTKILFQSTTKRTLPLKIMVLLLTPMYRYLLTQQDCQSHRLNLRYLELVTTHILVRDTLSLIWAHTLVGYQQFSMNTGSHVIVVVELLSSELDSIEMKMMSTTAIDLHHLCENVIDISVPCHSMMKPYTASHHYLCVKKPIMILGMTYQAVWFARRT